MSKYDFSKHAKDVAKELKDTTVNIGTGDTLGTVSDNPEDYVVMPDWWKESYGIPGLQFGRFTQIAGDSDSGKTTLAMQAMKCAQDQGYGCLYTETEGKTPTNTFKKWGIDSKGVMLAQSKVVENAFDASFSWIDKFFADIDPKGKLLFVFDSYGNTISLSDHDNKVSKESRVGGTAKVNRKALNILAAKMQKYPIAVLIVNYTYDNIGSVGKTNAGGKGLNFFCTLTIQSSRSGWITKGTGPNAKTMGAKVKWTTFKNHYVQGLEETTLPRHILLSITDEGFKKLEV